MVADGHARWSAPSPRPVVGRLGDGPRRRAVVLVVLAAGHRRRRARRAPLGLEWLIAGRGLQGFGLGLTPVAIATARDALTGERSRSTVAALSVTVAAGVGLGLPAAGLIAELGGVHAAFWTGAAISFLALARGGGGAAAVPGRPARRLDVVGAVLLGAGLAGLLLALGEAEVWGWTSPLLWAAAVGRRRLVLLAGCWESRTPSPLVDLRLARGRVAAHRARRGAAGRAGELPAARVGPDPRPGARGRAAPGSARRSWSPA